MSFFKLFFITCITFLLLLSCAGKQETWISEKSGDRPNDTVILDGDKILMTVHEFDIDETFSKKELVFEVVDHIYHPKNDLYCLYILKDKTGRYSAFPEYKVDANTRKFDVNLAKAQMDTKEKLMKELYKKIPVFNVAGVDSGEVFYSFFGQVKIQGETFIKQT